MDYKKEASSQSSYKALGPILAERWLVFCGFLGVYVLCGFLGVYVLCGFVLKCV